MDKNIIISNGNIHLPFDHSSAMPSGDMVSVTFSGTKVIIPIKLIASLFELFKYDWMKKCKTGNEDEFDKFIRSLFECKQ